MAVITLATGQFDVSFKSRFFSNADAKIFLTFLGSEQTCSTNFEVNDFFFRMLALRVETRKFVDIQIIDMC